MFRVLKIISITICWLFSSGFSEPVYPFTDGLSLSECYNLSSLAFHIDSSEPSNYKIIKESYVDCVEMGIALVTPYLHDNGVPVVAKGTELNAYLLHKELARFSFELGLDAEFKSEILLAFDQLELLFPKRLGSERTTIGDWAVFPYVMHGLPVPEIDFMPPANFKELLLGDFIEFIERRKQTELARKIEDELLPLAVEETNMYRQRTVPYSFLQEVNTRWFSKEPSD